MVESKKTREARNDGVAGSGLELGRRWMTSKDTRPDCEVFARYFDLFITCTVA